MENRTKITKEDKKLLLQDLCARLPYKVKAYESPDYPSITIDAFDGDRFLDCDGWEHEVGTFKPYLRPISSMTEEELYEYFSFVFKEYDGYLNDDTPDFTGNHFVYIEDVNPFIDWLNKNHFDYRGLIPKGLAIEVTKDNNPYEN